MAKPQGKVQAKVPPAQYPTEQYPQGQYPPPQGYMPPPQYAGTSTPNKAPPPGMQPNPMNQNAYQNPQQYPRKNKTTQLPRNPTTNNPCTPNHLHHLLLLPSSTTITTTINNKPQ